MRLVSKNRTNGTIDGCFVARAVMRTNDKIWIRNYQSCAAIKKGDAPGIVHRFIYLEEQCRIAHCELRVWNTLPYVICRIDSLDETQSLVTMVELVL